MSEVIIQPEDYKYYVAEPDPNFSPQRNKAVMDEIIRENEIFFKSRDQKVMDELMNRADIVGTYGRYRFGKGEKKFKDYVGKEMWTRLVGEQILEKIRVAEITNKLNGNTRFPKGILI